jgi:hypothetical protein
MYVQGDYSTTGLLQYSNLFSVNSSGTTQSYRSLNHTLSTASNGTAMTNLSDTIYYCTVTGSAGVTNTTSTGQIHKASLAGVVSWTRQLTNTSTIEYALGMAHNGTYVVSAFQTPAANQTNIIMYNDSGTLTYQRKLNVTIVSRIQPCVNATLTTNVICIGRDSANTVIHLINFNASGTVAWSKSWPGLVFGGPLGNSGLWVDSTATYAYALTMDTGSSTPEIQRINTLTGAADWQRRITFTGITAGQTRAQSITGDANSLYISCDIVLTTGTESKNFIFKVPLDGSLTGSYTVDGVSISYASATITISNLTTTFAVATDFTLSTVTADTTALANPTVGSVGNTTTTVSI